MLLDLFAGFSWFCGFHGVKSLWFRLSIKEVPLFSPFVSSVQLSSADLKKPLEKEAAKLKEMKDKMAEKSPGKAVPSSVFILLVWSIYFTQ